MNGIKPIQLESGRLLLRSSVEGDTELLFPGYFGSVESSQFLSRHPHSSFEQTNSFLKQWTQEAWQTPGVPFAWVIAKLESLEPVGIFLVFPKGEIAEIHYGISEGHRGCGFATEACGLAVSWLLGQRSIQRVTTAVDLEHTATQRVLENAGFQKGEILKNWSVLPAFGPQARDAVSYSKTK
jgi:ribosomal-protein-alanine N-acetyltransferase